MILVLVLRSRVWCVIFIVLLFYFLFVVFVLFVWCFGFFIIGRNVELGGFWRELFDLV